MWSKEEVTRRSLQTAICPGSHRRSQNSFPLTTPTEGLSPFKEKEIEAQRLRSTTQPVRVGAGIQPQF